jgi:RNA polymerase sigma factor (sigma-70 family)
MKDLGRLRGKAEGLRRLDDAEIRAFLANDYGRVVNAVAFGGLGYADAEDAVQEALIRAWGYAEAGNRIERLDAWVTVAAWNRSRSGLRRLGAERRAKERVAAMSSQADQRTRDEAIDLYRALAKLPRRLREVAVLRFLMGLTTAETAHALGIAEGTVKRALSDARTRLSAAVALTGTEEATDVSDR